MAIYTTEITSDTLDSDNPIHQRLIKAYYLAQPYIDGDLLEVGCGTGRGIALLQPRCQRYVAIDKIGKVLEQLEVAHPQVEFMQMNIPPMTKLPNNSFDRVVSFQVIEHIKDDLTFLRELKRVLKPGGFALITTPNIKFTLTRNPWHQREYQSHELQKLAEDVFNKVQIMGIAGNEKVMDYYYQNKQSVEKITRFDVFDFQHRMPASLLRIPYDILNRVNRRRLQKQDKQLVTDITHEDYILVEEGAKGLDLFCILTK